MASPLLIAFALLLQPPPPPPAPAVDDVLAQARQALAYDRLPAAGGVELRGDGTLFGIQGKYRLWFDRQGRFRRELTGPLGDVEGYDGATCWTRDLSGATRALDLRDREFALTTLWVQTGYWLAKENAPFDITVLPEETTDKKVTLRLDLKGGQLRATLALDRASGLPRKLQIVTRGKPHTWVYDDYRSLAGGGLVVAHRVSYEADGHGHTVTVKEAAAAPAGDDPPYRFAAQPVPGAAFDATLPAALEVKRAKTGHLLVHPRVHGQDVGWFILDSGAGLSVIDKTVADTLGMKALGLVPAVGVGGTTPVRFRQGKALPLGPLTLADSLYVELDLRIYGALMGEKIAGIAGYPVFQAAVVEIDCAAPAAALYDPARYELKNGQWQDLALDGNIPSCRARFEGHEGLFHIDTGSAGTVSFHAPAVERLKLLADRQTGVALEGGVGGMVTARSGKLAWFELGGHRFTNPAVTFSQAKQGAFRDEHTDGNIGQGFLQPFRVVFWYEGRKVAFAEKK